MRKRDRESYDVERGNGTEGQCCVANAEQLQILKRKTYERLNGDQRTEGPVEERNGSRMRKVKQEDASIIGTGFRLMERGVWDKCGQIGVSVRSSEEIIDGEIGWSVGGEENVGYVV